MLRLRFALLSMTSVDAHGVMLSKAKHPIPLYWRVLRGAVDGFRLLYPLGTNAVSPSSHPAFQHPYPPQSTSPLARFLFPLACLNGKEPHALYCPLGRYARD